jgi:hypothetical protein
LRQFLTVGEACLFSPNRPDFLPDEQVMGNVARKSEHRRAPRLAKSTPVQIVVWEQAEVCNTINATLVDMSATGIGVLSPVRLAKGDHFLLLTSKARLLYCVIRSFPAAGQHRVGGKLEMRLPAETDISHFNLIRRVLKVS